jgi:class 3 adenylate cyclase
MAPDGERRQLTVLFCDLVDSTLLSTRLDPEDLRDVVRAYQRASADVIEQHDGHIAQYLGDGLLVYFGYPAAHEDDARRAVSAGLGIVQAIDRLNTHPSPHPEVQLAVRVGIHTGLVVVGEMGGGPHREHLALGEVPNVAARLQALAAPGSVVISEETAELVRGHFATRALGPRRLKGKRAKVPLHEVVGPSRRGPRIQPDVKHDLAPLVGREAELQSLNDRFLLASSGRGQIVFVSGEPGIGKSRLIHEFRRRIEAEQVTWLEGHCISYGQTLSYWPYRQIIEQAAGIAEYDGEDERWAKLERLLQGFFPHDLDDVLPYLATLIGIEVRGAMKDRVRYLDGEGMARQIFRASRRLFERLTRQRVLVIVVEDAHWIDQSSVALVEHLLPLVVHPAETL